MASSLAATMLQVTAALKSSKYLAEDLSEFESLTPVQVTAELKSSNTGSKTGSKNSRVQRIASLDVVLQEGVQMQPEDTGLSQSPSPSALTKKSVRRSAKLQEGSNTGSKTGSKNSRVQRIASLDVVLQEGEQMQPEDTASLKSNLLGLADVNVLKKDNAREEFSFRLKHMQKTLDALEAYLVLEALGSSIEQIHAETGPDAYKDLQAALAELDGKAYLEGRTEALDDLDIDLPNLSAIDSNSQHGMEKARQALINFGKADCTASADDLKSELERLDALNKAKSDGDDWKSEIDADAPWSEVLKISQKNLFTFKGFAAKLTKQLDLVEKLEEQFLTLLGHYNVKADFQANLDEVTKSLKRANVTHMEAMVIQVCKDAKTSDSDKATEMQGVLDLMPEKKLAIGDLHLTVAQQMNKFIKA